MAQRDVRIARFRDVSRCSAVLCVALSLAGCASDSAPEGGLTVSEARDADAQNPADERDVALRRMLEEYVRSTNARQESQRDRVIRRRPYYFREYAEYPDAGDLAEIEFRETDSQTTPYVAEVKLEKVRYATRFRKKRDEARDDTEFLRSTGEETLSYEWRNGSWQRTGSLFVAERTEERVDGEWRQIEYETPQSFFDEDAEASRSLTDRLLFWRD